jgi:hypothetical protein
MHTFTAGAPVDVNLTATESAQFFRIEPAEISAKGGQVFLQGRIPPALGSNATVQFDLDGSGAFEWRYQAEEGGRFAANVPTEFVDGERIMMRYQSEDGTITGVPANVNFVNDATTTSTGTELPVFEQDAVQLGVCIACETCCDEDSAIGILDPTSSPFAYNVFPVNGTLNYSIFAATVPSGSCRRRSDRNSASAGFPYIAPTDSTA